MYQIQYAVVDGIWNVEGSVLRMRLRPLFLFEDRLRQSQEWYAALGRSAAR